MPHPYGTDRLHQRPDGSVVLLCPFSKGWLPRKPRTNTSPEMPGTAVYWDDEYWEVIREDPGAAGRMSYVLAPMRDNHTIRSFEGYSAHHEAARLEAHERELALQQRSLLGSVFAFALGLLPCDVQRELESEIGVVAERMTMLSTVPFLLFGVFCASRLQIEGLPKPQHPLPPAVVQAGLLLFGEALFRLRSAMAGQPIGELFVTIPYLLFVGPFRRKPVRHVRPQPPAPPTDVVVRDVYSVREPFLAFLSPDEQREMQRIFSFDPIAWGWKTATALLIASAIGVVVGIGKVLQPSHGFISVVSLLGALALAVEQLIRFGALGRGEPAGSFLAPLLRPFTRKLFDPRLYESSSKDSPADTPVDDQR